MKDSFLTAWLRACFGDSVGVSVAVLDRFYPMYPEEQALVTNAVPSRVVEFSTGRWCLRQALQRVGAAPQPILMGNRREPLLPPGYRAALTHAAGLCAAVAAPHTHCRGLGIDIVDLHEAEQTLAKSFEVIASPAEVEAAGNSLPFLFSAKESAIKAITDHLETLIEFTDMQVVFDGSEFRATTRHVTGIVEGYWTTHEGLGFTTAIFPNVS